MIANWLASLGLGVAATMLAATVMAQSPPTDDAEKEIERYRAMLSDPFSNPGFLAVDRGELLWATPHGTRNVTLEQCDLGMGPGVLEGAFAHAAPAVGLLPAAALAGAGIRLRRADRAHHVFEQAGRRRRDRRSLDQASSPWLRDTNSSMSIS